MKLIVSFTLLFVFCCKSNAGSVFQVGGVEGWKVPSDPNVYNSWASSVEIHLGDILEFISINDSVLWVNEKDYETCTTSNPIRKYNVRESYYSCTRLGAVYFISGTLGHCEQGQKIAVQVLPTSTPTYLTPSPVTNFDVPIVDGPPTQGESSVDHHKRKIVVVILLVVVIFFVLVVALICQVVRARRSGGFSRGSQVEMGKWASIA